MGGLSDPKSTGRTKNDIKDGTGPLQATGSPGFTSPSWSDVPIGVEEFFVQLEDGKTLYRKVKFYGRSPFVRLNSDRLSPFTNLAKQQFTSVRIEIVEERALQSYINDLQAQSQANRKKAFADVSRKDGPIVPVDIDFDLIFAWRTLGSLVGETVAETAEKTTGRGLLLWNILHGDFGGPLGVVIDLPIERLSKSVFKSVLRVANVRSPWALEIGSGVATNIVGGKIGDALSDDKQSSKYPLYPWEKSVEDRLRTALAFQHYAEYQWMSKFKLPGADAQTAPPQTKARTPSQPKQPPQTPTKPPNQAPIKLPFKD